MPHRNFGIIRPPTNFTIDRILSKNDQHPQNSSSSPLHSPGIIHHHHPMNKVLESNPWIPKCSPLVLPFTPSFSKKLNFASVSSSNYINNLQSNIPINYANSNSQLQLHQHCLTSTFNYLSFSPSNATVTATITAPTETQTHSTTKIVQTRNISDNIHNHSKYSVYEDSQCDSMNQLNSFSINRSVVSSNKVFEENTNRRTISVDPIIKASKISLSTDNRNGNFRCAICFKSFSSCELMKIHDKIHIIKPKYECNVCEKKFSQLRNYKYHMSVHLGTKEFAADCPECGKTFNDRGYLSSHMKIHRNKKEYNCSYCPKSFNQRVAFNMHVRIHLGLKPHTCQECGKQFSRKMLLKQHHRTHSGEKPYKCTFSGCEKRFADRSNMILHHRLHSGIKPFACSICPKRFSKKHHLGTHMNYHTGNKPYECLNGCGQRFTQSSNMRTHAKKCQFKMHSSDETVLSTE